MSKPRSTATTLKKSLFAGSALLLSLGAFGVSFSANAETCRSKPAVCMRLKAEAKTQKAAPQSQSVRTSTCGTKTAVCMRMRHKEAAQQNRSTVAPPADAPKVSAAAVCRSKPAICQMQRQRAAQ